MDVLNTTLVKEDDVTDPEQPKLAITAGQRYHQWVRQNPAAGDDQTCMVVEAYRNDAHRYRDALEEVWSMMGPQDSEHTQSCITCEGCLFEWEETLQIVRNVLDGKEPDDHWSEPVKIKPPRFRNG